MDDVKVYNVREVDYAEWLECIHEFEHTNLLQFWQYGSAKEDASHLWKAIRFAIFDDNEGIIALVQLLVISVPLLGGLARINRGPMLHRKFDHNDKSNVSIAVISAILKKARERHWWIVQIAPEIMNSTSASNGLKSIGLQKLNTPPSASGLISLTPNEDELLMSLKGKWRNCLRKGWRLGVDVTAKTGNSSDLDTLLTIYGDLQKNKDFLGIPNSFIVSLSMQQGDGWEFTLFIANEKDHDSVDKTLGMLVSIRHGDTSTYFIGATNDKGRQLQVNYVLLWEAILYAKEKGCSWFDIGGLNSTTPKGIAHFKSGVNSNMYDLIGEWRGVIFQLGFFQK